MESLSVTFSNVTRPLRMLPRLMLIGCPGWIATAFTVATSNSGGRVVCARTRVMAMNASSVRRIEMVRHQSDGFCSVRLDLARPIHDYGNANQTNQTARKIVAIWSHLINGPAPKDRQNDKDAAVGCVHSSEVFSLV